jgi:heptosyltransferase-2/heptosyltransferase-3
MHHMPSLKSQIRRIALRTVAKLPISRNRNSIERRILLIRPDHLGDMLLTTPAIHALRNALPRAEIHVLAGPWSAQVLANNPDVDHVLTLPFPGFNRDGAGNSLSPYTLALTSARQLRKLGYGSALIMRPDHWWGAMLAFFAGIPHRRGYNHPDVRPFLSDSLLLTHQHAVEQNLRLVEQWTGPIEPNRIRYEFMIDDADRDHFNTHLADMGIALDQPIFCIHPGSGAWAKLWDNSQWAVVADTLTDQLDAAAVFTGGEHERALVTEITAQMKRRAHVLVGETGVGQLAALYARSRVVLGPDSGPMHLAAAVDAPTVTLFGPADPVEFAPWGAPKRHIVLTTDIGCRPCRVLDWSMDDPENHPCVREIMIGDVLTAAREVSYNGDD